MTTLRRLALAGLLALAPAARATDVDTPRIRAPGEPAAPATLAPVTRSLPEWLGQVTGLASSPPAAPVAESGAAHWHLLPFVFASPLVGVGAGLAGVGAVRLGPSASTSHSSFVASALVTSNSQFGGLLRTDLRLPDNDWILVGDWGWSRFPNPAWGLGGSSPDSDRTIVDRKLIRFHESVYRQLVPRLYLGGGYFLDDFYDITDRRAARGEATAFSAYGIGTSGRSLSSGVAASILYDRRDDPIDPTHGVYALARWRTSPRALGSDDSWHSLWVDLRAYLPVADRPDVVAFWAFGWVTYGRTPYLMLPAIGSDPEQRSGRGYIEARHVGRDLVGVEVEYRFHVWEWLGGVVGGNLHGVSERAEFTGQPNIREWSPALVVGLRALLDRVSRSSLTVDLALAPGGQPALYVNANQAF